MPFSQHKSQVIRGSLFLLANIVDAQLVLVVVLASLLLLLLYQFLFLVYLYLLHENSKVFVLAIYAMLDVVVNLLGAK